MNSPILWFLIIILLALGQAFWLGYQMSKPSKKIGRRRLFLIKGGKNE